MSTSWQVAVVALALLELTLAGAVIVLARRLSALPVSRLAPPASASLAGSSAPAVAGQDVRSGMSVSTADFAGRPVVLAFVSEGCSYCHRLVPHLNRFAKDQSGRVEVITVIAGGMRDAERFAGDHGLRTYALSDRQTRASTAHEVKTTPYAVVLDAIGAPAARGGVAGYAELERLVSWGGSVDPGAEADITEGPPEAERRPLDLEGLLGDEHLADQLSALGLSLGVRTDPSTRTQIIDVAAVANGAEPLAIVIDPEVAPAFLAGEISPCGVLSTGTVIVHGPQRSVGAALRALAGLSAAYRREIGSTDAPSRLTALEGLDLLNPRGAHVVSEILTTVDGPLVAALVLSGLSPVERAIEQAAIFELYLRGRLAAEELRLFVAALTELAATSPQVHQASHDAPILVPSRKE